MKKFFKKATAVFVALMVSISTYYGIFSVTADVTDEVKTGTLFRWGDWTQNTFEKQGQQGFYAMYSTETNSGSAFPVNSAYLLERDKNDSSPYWKIPYSDGGFENDFFIGSGVDNNGNPTSYQAAVNLKTGYSAVLRWVAPADGSYSVSAKWRSNDHTGVFTAGNDGMTVGVYLNERNIFSYEQAEDISGWKNDKCPSFNNDGKNIQMRRGESLYFVGDPKSDGANDSPWVSIVIEYRCEIKENRDLPAADTKVNPAINSVYHWGDWAKNTFAKQGQQGFYAMFSTSVNQTEKFPVNTAALCERNTDEKQPYWMIPLANGGFDTQFLIGAGTNYTGNPTNHQSAVNLKNGYSAIIRWVAPTDGYYSVKASWKCHDAAGTFSGNDGLICSIYKNEEKLFDKNITEEIGGWDRVYPKWNNDGNTVGLKKRRKSLLYSGSEE